MYTRVGMASFGEMEKLILHSTKQNEESTECATHACDKSDVDRVHEFMRTIAEVITGALQCPSILTALD